MKFNTYCPDTSQYIESNGTVHHLKTVDGEVPAEVAVLIGFKNGSLSLQDAVFQLLQLKQKDSSKYHFSQNHGDVCISFGAETKDELYQMITDYENA